MRKSRKRASPFRAQRSALNRKRVSRKRVSKRDSRRRGGRKNINYRMYGHAGQPTVLWGHDYTKRVPCSRPLSFLADARHTGKLWEHDYTKPVSSREVFLRKIGNVVPPLPYDTRTEIKYKLRVLSLLKLIDNCLIVPEGDTPINSKEFLQELLNAKIIYSYEYYDHLEIKIDDQKTYFLKQKEGVLGSVFGNINDVYDIWGEILANYLDKFKKLEKLELDTRFPREWGLKNLKHIPPKLEYLSMPLLEVSPEFCRNIKVLEITYDFPLTDEYINSLKKYSNIEVLIIEIDPDQEPYDAVHKRFPNNPVFYFFEILKTKFPNLKKLILTSDREIIYES